MKSIGLPLLWFLLWLGTTSTATPVINNDADIAARSFTLAHSLYPRTRTRNPFQPGALVKVSNEKYKIKNRRGVIVSLADPSTGPVKVLVYPMRVKPKSSSRILEISYNARDKGFPGLELLEPPLEDKDKLEFVGNPTNPDHQGWIRKTGVVTGPVQLDTKTGTCTVSITWADGGLKIFTGPRTWFKRLLVFL